MSLIHAMEDNRRWSSKKGDKCAYSVFLLRKCKRENKKNCAVYERALKDCQQGRLYFGDCCNQYSKKKY